MRTFATTFLITLLFIACSDSNTAKPPTERPNILMVLSDDQSWPHAGAYGTDWISTPNFDALAREGVLFNQAFVSAPSCAPSRAAILAGRHFYQMEEGGVHGGFIPEKFPLYTHLLEESGYFVGYTGKSCGPFWINEQYGQTKDPYGQKFNQHRIPNKLNDVHSYNNIDYVANFEAFLDQVGDRPFHFSFNSWEPHRPYLNGTAEAHGREAKRLDIPTSMPDIPVVRNEFNEYSYEIERFDRDLGRFIKILKERGLYKKTIIVVTSDNGMPFPNAKMHCYELGTHVPFVISWPGVIPHKPASDALISVPEVAGFFLQASGCDVPVSMMDSSLAGLLNLQEFRQNPENSFVVWGKEKHNPARENNMGYPIRAIRTSDYLLVKNYEPDRWPAGPPPHFKDLKWANHALTMVHLIEHQENPLIEPFFASYTKKRPSLELFDVRSDPTCTRNLAGEPTYSTQVSRLERMLEAKLKADGDPRVLGHGDFFDSTPSQFKVPMDPANGEPIFSNFPNPKQPVPGLSTFDHSDDSVEKNQLRQPKPH